MATKIVNLKAYFEKHTKLMPSGCIEWQRCKDKDGYGVIKIERKQQRMNRVAWILANGEIPEEMMVLHKCDNPACCNLGHLFLGTHVDNMKDKAAKGRWNGPDNRGENNGRAKFTEQDIRDIRAATGTQCSIANRYGVHSVTISAIKLRKRWRHVK